MTVRRALFVLSLLFAASPSDATVAPQPARMALLAQEAAAEHGDVVAMTNLGWRYFHGDGVARDYAQAVKWFRLGAAKDNASAMYGLALCLQNGNGVDKDTASGDRLMRVAADKGDSGAQVEIGLAAEQRGAFDEARPWYARSADQGDAYGLRNLGLLYRNARGVPADASKAYGLLLQSAERGNSQAMYNVADMLEEGEGVTKDLASAREWFRKSAELGDQDARYQLGRFLANGLGGEPDVEQAAKLYRIGADEGHLYSIYYLADAYFEGAGVPRDYAEARRWLAKGAQLGDERSMIRLGRILLSGANTPVDEPAAAKLFQQAAEAGDHTGEYWLGFCLERGKGVARDEAKAAALYRLASKDIPAARNSLIVMQIQGRGMPRDAAKAHALVDQQIANGKFTDMLDLGVRLLNQDADADAESVFQRVRSAPDSTGARNSIEFAGALIQVGRTYRGKLRYDASERFLKDALTLLEHLPEVPPDTLGDALDELAVVYQQSERPQPAAQLLERSLALRIKAHGERDALVADAYSNLAWLYTMINQVDRAEHYRRLSLAIKVDVFGSDSAEADRSRASLANALYGKGKYGESEQLYVQALGSIEARLGKEHPSLVNILDPLGYLYMESGRPELAEATIRRANAIFDKFDDGKVTHATATRLNNLGAVLVAAKRYPEAEDALLKSLAMREQLLGPDHVDVGISLINLGKLYIATARYAEADAVLARALPISSASTSADWDVGDILHLQGLSQQKQGRNEQAAAAFRRALDVRMRVQASHPLTKQTASALEEVYRSLGKEAAATQVEVELTSAANAKAAAPGSGA